VWGALRALGAERIGHGVRAIEDPALVAYLAEYGIPLEVCPTSNVRLGIYPSLANHPLPLLHAAGVPLTINSDDPPLFNTTLDDEVALLGDVFGLSMPALDEVLLNGVRYSFLPPERSLQGRARPLEGDPSLMQPGLDHENCCDMLAGRHVTRRWRRSGRPRTEGERIDHVNQGGNLRLPCDGQANGPLRGNRAMWYAWQPIRRAHAGNVCGELRREESGATVPAAQGMELTRCHAESTV
jgi:hypothetical protein